MGSREHSSGEHREHKKKKHKRHSHEDHERRKHKKHKHKSRKRERSLSYDEISGSDGEIQPSPKKISRKEAPPAPEMSGNEISLSIEESNRLRASLGLAPLKVDNAPANKIPGIDLGPQSEASIPGLGTDDFVHQPAVNLLDKKKTEDLKTKLQTRK